MPHEQYLRKRVGRPPAESLKLLPELPDLPGLARQLLFIVIHDPLAIGVEEAEMEHVVHGGHEDEILAHNRDPTDVLERGHQAEVTPPPDPIGIYTARTALLATTWDRSAVSAFGRHQGVSYPQALGNKGLETGTASDQQVQPTPMQVGTTAARPVPPKSCGENRCVDTNALIP